MPSQPQSNDFEGRREWSDIPQTGGRRATTKVAVKRKWTRIGKYVGMGVLICSLCGVLIYASVSASRDVNALEPVTLLESVSFRSDGVLTGDWLSGVLKVEQGLDMNKLDIASIRGLIEAQGQIKSAMVERRLPNGLIIEVRERTPLMRARAQLSADKIVTLIIASDGTVYQGAMYPAGTIRALPYVSDVVIKRKSGGAGFESLGDISKVAELLDMARSRFPSLYREFKSVSLARIRSGTGAMGFIDVGSRTLGTLVFSTRDFEDQLRRLESLVAQGVATGSRTPLKRIDLSIPGQGIVEYEPLPARTTGRGR